jgi:hypothetical protein
MHKKEDSAHQPDGTASNSPKWIKKLTMILISVLLLTMFGLGGYWLGARQQQSSPRDFLAKPKSIVSNPSVQPLSTTPTYFPFDAPAALGAYFPTQQIEYPSDWPSDLFYPEEFILVEALVSPYPDGTGD